MNIKIPVLALQMVFPNGSQWCKIFYTADKFANFLLQTKISNKYIWKF